MRGVIYTAIVAIPVALGLLRSRQWLAAQLRGQHGALWCAVGALGVGLIPALLVGLLPDSASALKHHLLFSALAAPMLGGAALLCRRRAVPGDRPAAAMGGPDAAASGPTAVASAAPEAPAGAAAPPPQGAAAVIAPKANQPGPARTRLSAPEPPPPQSTGSPRARSAPRPSPAAAALRAVRAADEPEDQHEAAAETPTTVTECILTMSISCEECLLRNFQEMARAPLPEAQRETLTRLVEETDDKLARLRAARRRHHGEELVRVTWNELPDVDLPVVSPGSSVAQIREKAMRQTEVMIGFYRTVATFAQRPSLKSLLATLALDGQRHLSVIEQSG
jgi:hypothetical protein